MSIYKRHRFPRDIIAYAVWLYYHFNLSRREIGDLLAERETIVSREGMRLWCITFGTMHMRRVIARHDYSEAAGYAEIKVGSAGSPIFDCSCGDFKCIQF
jgi:transposase-like protein